MISMEVANSSLMVAKESQRDNKTMKELAKNSNMVAMAAARDSATMRTIAVVTILFLPATFTAVSYLLWLRIY